MIGALSWMFSASAAMQACRLLVLVILARLLSPTEFGLVALWISLFAFAEAMIGFGLSTALVQVKECTQQLAGKVLGLTLLLAVCLGIICQLAWMLFAKESSTVASPLTLILLTLVIATAGESSLAMLQREMRFQYIAKVETVAFLIGPGVFAILLAQIGFGYWSMLVGMAVRYSLRTLAFQRAYPVFPQLRGEGRELRQALDYGLGIVSGQLANVSSTKIDNLICGWVLGLSALGIYTRAYAVIEMANTSLGHALRAGVFAGFAKLFRQDSAAQRDGLIIFHDLYFLVFMVSIPCTIACVRFSQYIVTVLLGDNWLSVATPLALLSIGISFRLGTKIAASVLLAAGRAHTVARLQWLLALLVAGGAYAGVEFGLVGVVVGTLTALGVHWLVVVRAALHQIGASFLPEMIGLFRGPVRALVVGFAALFLANLSVQLFGHEQFGIVVFILIAGPAGIAFCHRAIARLKQHTDWVKLA